MSSIDNRSTHNQKLIITAIFILFFASITFCSCAHKQITGKLLSPDDIKAPNEHFNFSDSQKVKLQIKNIGSLQKKNNQKKLIRFLRSYLHLKKNFISGEISLLPKTATSFKLQSFCADSNKAIPNQNEIFQWTKGQPNILLIRPLIRHYSKSNKNKYTKYQEIIWNLSNNTYYENYPPELKKIINSASSKALVVLPSKTKNDILEEILPSELNNTINFIKGNYYSFQDFSSIVENNSSKEKLSNKAILSEIPETSLYAKTKSNGYQTQEITVYNPTYNKEHFSIFDYYLEPKRSDVQPIIIAGVIPNLSESEKLLNESALKLLGYLGSQYPTLNSAEKQLVKDKPIEAAIAFYYARQAEKLSEEQYPDSSINGNADALRHFLWAGYLTRELGETTARKFLNAHEEPISQPRNQKDMDMYNNEQGIEASVKLLEKGSCKDSELLKLGKDFISKNKLKTLKK